MQDDELRRLVALIATWVAAGANVRAGMEFDRETFQGYADHTVNELMALAFALGEARGVSEEEVMDECKVALSGLCVEGMECH
jgi:hypothetical protein